jgi:hypothetical protein
MLIKVRISAKATLFGIAKLCVVVSAILSKSQEPIDHRAGFGHMHAFTGPAPSELLRFHTPKLSGIPASVAICEIPSLPKPTPIGIVQWRFVLAGFPCFNETQKALASYVRQELVEVVQPRMPEPVMTVEIDVGDLTHKKVTIDSIREKTFHMLIFREGDMNTFIVCETIAI